MYKDQAEMQRAVVEDLVAMETQVTEALLAAVRDREYDTAARFETIVSALRQALKSIPPIGGSHHAPTTIVEQADRARASSVRRGGRKPAYPRFEMDGRSLIRVGWSKKKKREYVHKVQRPTYDQVVGLIASVARGRDRAFVAEDVVNRANSAEPQVPSYQVYVILAFLLHKKILSKRGRTGYVSTAELASRSVEIWSE